MKSEKYSKKIKGLKYPFYEKLYCIWNYIRVNWICL